MKAFRKFVHKNVKIFLKCPTLSSWTVKFLFFCKLFNFDLKTLNLLIETLKKPFSNIKELLEKKEFIIRTGRGALKVTRIKKKHLVFLILFLILQLF